MRVFLANEIRDDYFVSLKSKANLSWQEIAKGLGVNGRMFRSWRSGELTIPKDLLDKVNDLYDIKIPDSAKLLQEYWHIKEAARKGGLSRLAKYGNLGTSEGRQKGGLNSLKSPKLRGTNFKFRKQILLPKRSNQLAELVGIMIGDGGISYFQARVTLGLEKDKEYAFFVKSIFERLFGVSVSVFETKKDSTIEVIVSSRALVEFLTRCGLPVGNKIRQGIDIPVWIKENRNWSKLCLRGIFDTDGCVYIDCHRGKYRTYKSINVAFSSASQKLLLSIFNILSSEGFAPTTTSKDSVRLRRSKEVMMFFETIGSDNLKHLSRFRDFLRTEEYPSGHTGTVSKTVGVVRST